MYLYFCNRIPNVKSDSLVIEAIMDYSKRESFGFTEEYVRNLKISRGLHGKPYFENNIEINHCDLPMIHFSISHSGFWWACIIADQPIGFDMEDMCKYRNTARYESIAKRFFTEEEENYVLENGKNGFFEIWVRKEAYVKYLGTGLSQGLSTFSVIKDNQLVNSIEYTSNKTFLQEKVYLNRIIIKDDIKAACCTENDKKVKKIIELDR